MEVTERGWATTRLSRLEISIDSTSLKLACYAAPKRAALQLGLGFRWGSTP
jgi:hypothetical protein